jgi:GcrA cell cycle regulator
MNWPRSGSSWNDERIELLKQMWDHGCSASQIAAHLGMESRNAVIGKIHRLGLAGRKVLTRTQEDPKRSHKAIVTQLHRNPSGWRGKPKKFTSKPLPSLPGPSAFPDRRHLVGIFEHKEGQCRWIVVDAVPNIHDLRYCGAEVEWSGCSYCQFHRRMAE